MSCIVPVQTLQVHISGLPGYIAFYSVKKRHPTSEG